MTIFTTPQPLKWGELDMPMLGLEKDWYGNPLHPPAAYSLVMDGRHLWFIAHHRRPARLHPQARPGMFQAGLWEYDVVELFIADPVSGRYFEFNLAPNGAWWSCEFSAPRVRAEKIDIPMPEVATFSDMDAEGSWLVAMCLPLDFLKARLDFGPGSRANVTMILESPDQRFITATDLGTGEPDYHQPQYFPEVTFTTLA
ncbi:MAG: hypothetical protein WCS43_11475 [Verrucomicrobiota bacterium]